VKKDKYKPHIDRGVLPPDRFIPPPPDKGPGKCNASGTPCGSGAARCCPGTTCMANYAGPRLCLQKCVPDNPSTPLVNEDTCPVAGGRKMVCGNMAIYPGTNYHCLRRCDPALGKNDCPAGLACHPRSGVFTRQGANAVCVYAPCAGPQQCPVYLNKTCTTSGSAAQCAGAGLPNGARCGSPPPNAPAGAQLRCVVPGVCDAKSGLCAPHKYGNPKAKVGDSCKDDRDCGGQMWCDMQTTDSSGRTHARNGYCSIISCAFPSLTAFRCPSGAHCSNLYYGGRCFKGCDLKNAKTCRGNAKDKHGDYECRAWNNLAISGGIQITKGPVCEPGDLMKCNIFQGANLTCSVVGLQGNGTDMACRTPGTGKKLSKYAPNGYCLDNTSSGK